MISTAVLHNFFLIIKKKKTFFGEPIVINDSIDDQKEWVMTITSFVMYGPVENKYHFFVDDTYYAARVTAWLSIEVDDWTRKERMIKKKLQ